MEWVWRVWLVGASESCEMGHWVRGKWGDFGAGERGERRSGRAQMGVRYGANGAFVVQNVTLCGATAPVRGGGVRCR